MNMRYICMFATGAILGLALAGCVSDPSVESATAERKFDELGDSLNSCSSGSALCCNALLESNTTNLSQLGGLLGLSLPNLGGLIGLTCSPITVLGTGGNSCPSQPVCCTNNSFGGLIALGCTPMNLQ